MTRAELIARIGAGRAMMELATLPVGQRKASVVIADAGECVREVVQPVRNGVNVEGKVRGIVAVGEGLETMLSLRVALPGLPIVAAGSANHLDALLLPEGLHRLYVAEDDDPAGRRATASVMSRAEAAGIEAMRLAPALGDFNDDLQQLGRDPLRAVLRVQLAPEDVERFWTPGRESVRAA